MKLKSVLKVVFGMSLLMSVKILARTKPNDLNLMAEMVKSVYFAPEENRGTFKFQLFKDGTVQNIDNKGVIYLLGKMKAADVQKMKLMIKKVDSTSTLLEPNHPDCMDAPITSTFIYKESKFKPSKQILIKSKMCAESLTSDKTARTLAEWIHALNIEFSNKQEDNQSPPASIGQEGYSSPKLNDLTQILDCESTSTPDSKVLISVFKKERTEKDYLIVLTDTKNEMSEIRKFDVQDNTDFNILGSPRIFSNSEVNLSVQGTVTPRPDHKLMSGYVEKFNNGTTQVISLLCKYIE